jgi:pimeloyl-ACP methyl ester carboxylesterase
MTRSIPGNAALRGCFRTPSPLPLSPAVGERGEVVKQPLIPGLGEGWVRVDGVRLHYVEAGAGPAVLLLHGFPEFWYSWRHQLPALAAAGFRAIALDLRGYNLSDSPCGVWHYRLGCLMSDLAGVVRQVAAGPAFVVGHDWGGGLAWMFAARRPELVRRLVILNAPHPARFRAELENWRQRLRSLYMRLFQFGGLPEMLLRAGNFALTERTWRTEPVNPSAFTADDIVAYKRVFMRPGALTGPLNYYRALFRYPREMHGPDMVRVPTLVLWGERDRYLGVNLTKDLERWAPDVRVELINASHWLQNDAPERVNRELVGFFSGAD